jgi:hypothetical protein
VTRYVIDTNLYVEAIHGDNGNAALAAFQRRFAPLLFQHSTVAQELLAGQPGGCPRLWRSVAGGIEVEGIMDPGGSGRDG